MANKQNDHNNNHKPNNNRRGHPRKPGETVDVELDADAILSFIDKINKLNYDTTVVEAIFQDDFLTYHSEPGEEYTEEDEIEDITTAFMWRLGGQDALMMSFLSDLSEEEEKVSDVVCTEMLHQFIEEPDKYDAYGFKRFGLIKNPNKHLQELIEIYTRERHVPDDWTPLDPVPYIDATVRVLDELGIPCHVKQETIPRKPKPRKNQPKTDHPIIREV